MEKHGDLFMSTNRIYSKNFNCLLSVCYENNFKDLKLLSAGNECLETSFSQHVIKVTVRLTLGCDQIIKLLLLKVPMCDSNCSFFRTAKETKL